MEPITKRAAPIALLLPLLLALLATSCGSEEKRDCRQVCERYRECVSPDFDADACRDKCATKVDDRDFVAQLDHCATCIESRTCSEATASCLLPCLGIVR